MGSSVWMVCDGPHATHTSFRLICDEGPPLRQEDTHQWVSRTACHHAEQNMARPDARVRVASRMPMLARMTSTLPCSRRHELCHDTGHLSTRRRCALHGALTWMSAGCSLEHDRVLTPGFQKCTRSCGACAHFEVPHRGSAECASRPCTRSRRTVVNAE